MNELKDILAKPYGISLEEHVNNVLNEGQNICSSFPFTFTKYEKRTGKSLARRLRGAIKFHDDGKKDFKWQEACKKDYEAFLNWQKAHVGDYEQFSKSCKNESGKNLRTSGVRHEIASLEIHYKSNFSLPVKIAIAAHHSKLSRKYEERWTNKTSGEHSKELWNEFFSLNGTFRNFHYFDEAVGKHYELAGVRSFLQLADHRASAKEGGDLLPQFTPFSYQFPTSWEKRPVQKIAEEFANEDLLLLRAPTGAGKTDAALLWASLQIQNGKADRLVIAMPTRFTSNALSISVSEDLSSTGLYHSSAWFTKYYKDVKSGVLDKSFARKEHELARELLTSVTVCTVDHLLTALTLSREDHHSILFNLANSCVVVDEADFYDEFTQANILILLRALKLLEVPVMIMSASLPESSLEMYQATGYDIRDIKEDTSDNSRIRCEIMEKRPISAIDEMTDLLQNCIDNGNAIIYTNTVARAMMYYNWFKDREITPILYHSRFTEPHKKDKEKELLDALGKEAWKNGRAGGIAILTQIGEMSVNISSDFMISDICPMDRLVQRAGRLCRFQKDKIGKLFVILPQKDDQLYPAPYGEYIKSKGWIPYPALLRTDELIKCKGYSASDFVNLINEVYPKFDEFSSRASQNAILLKEKFISNWIILPLDQSREDDTDHQEWKSRDIGGTETVFTVYPEFDNFHYWQDFQEFKIENSIDVPVYLIQKGLNDHQLVRKEISVSDEKISILIAVNCYDSTVGLKLSINDTRDLIF